MNLRTCVPVLFVAAFMTSSASPASPGFHVGRANGKWWITTPNHRRIFSFGVCCVDTGQDFSSFSPANPGYAAYQHYPDRRHWSADVVKRLQHWGFNTVGAWSDAVDIMKNRTRGLYFTPILHMGAAAGAPWTDMWDPKVVALMTSIAKKGMAAYHNDPRILGVFSDNELGWWTGALFDWAWKSKFSRAHLIGTLKARYPTWTDLLKDFEPVGAGSYGALEVGGRLYLRPGGNGLQAINAYVGVLADRYYQLCRTIIKSCDPNALYLGDRYISTYYPDVAKAAGKWCDIVSTNLNPDWNDGTIAPFYLSELAKLTGRPLLVSEYYACAMQNRSGNKNSSSGFALVKTQRERAKTFLNTTLTLLHNPSVVGAHWFQYYDEPQNGRGDGENYDMGLVDIHNVPYRHLTLAAASLSLDREHERASTSSPTSSTVPRLRQSQLDSLANWPRSQAILAQGAGDAGADAYEGWTPHGLEVAVYWNDDRFFSDMYATGKTPREDQPLVVVKIGKQRFRVRLASKNPVATAGAKVLEYSGGVRNTLVLQVPAAVLGTRSIALGDLLPLGIQLFTSGRAFGMRWQVTRPLGTAPK